MGTGRVYKRSQTPCGGPVHGGGPRVYVAQPWRTKFCDPVSAGRNRRARAGPLSDELWPSGTEWCSPPQAGGNGFVPQWATIVPRVSQEVHSQELSGESYEWFHQGIRGLGRSGEKPIPSLAVWGSGVRVPLAPPEQMLCTNRCRAFVVSCAILSAVRLDHPVHSRHGDRRRNGEP